MDKSAREIAISAAGVRSNTRPFFEDFSVGLGQGFDLFRVQAIDECPQLSHLVLGPRGGVSVPGHHLPYKCFLLAFGKDS